MSAPAAVPVYGLAPPSETDFHVALRRQLGASAAEAAWDAALRACAVGAYAHAHTLADLERIAEHLIQRTGMTGIVGRSMLIRLRAYTCLALRASGAPADATDATAPPA